MEYHKASPPWVSFVSKLNYTTNYNQSVSNLTVHHLTMHTSVTKDTPSLDLELNSSSSPLSKQSHDTSTKNHSQHHESQPPVILGAVGVKQEVTSKQLNQTSV